MSYWSDASNRVLAPMFADGKQPTQKEITEAYPFGPREYWPYKVWLGQVKWWKACCPPRRLPGWKYVPPKGQQALP